MGGPLIALNQALPNFSDWCDSGKWWDLDEEDEECEEDKENRENEIDEEDEEVAVFFHSVNIL